MTLFVRWLYYWGDCTMQFKCTKYCFYRCRRQPSLAAGTNISLHDIPATTVSPELVTHTLTVTAPTDIDSQNTQSVAPSGDTNVTPLKPEAVSNVSLDDLNDCKSHKWRKRQNKDKDNPRDDYALARVGDWTDGNWVICHTGRTRPIHGGLPPQKPTTDV